jgi:hypothetical protein
MGRDQFSVCGGLLCGEVHGFGEEGVAVEAGLVGVGDGVDEEFVEFEVVGEGVELGGNAVGGADEVAGPLALFGGVEGAGDEGEQGVGWGGLLGVELAEGVFGGGDGAAVVLADAALEEADAGVEAFGFGLGVGADDADAEGGVGLGKTG